MTSRGQIAIELMVIMSVMAIIFLSLFAQFSVREQAIGDSRTRIDAEREAAKIALAANSLMAAPPGAWVIVRPDPAVGGKNYSISLRGRRVELAWDKGTASRPLMTSNFSGSVTPGSPVRITKTSGGISFGNP